MTEANEVRAAGADATVADSRPAPFASLDDAQTAGSNGTGAVAGIDGPPAGHPDQPVAERRWFTRRREDAPVAAERRAARGRRRGETPDAGSAASTARPSGRSAARSAARSKGAGTRTGAAEQPAPWWRREYGRSVEPEIVMGFSRQMASFVEAGISVLEALEIVGEEVGDPAMRKVVERMHATIQRGGSFSEAVGEHTSVFPPYYRAMVRSAEFTGRLDEVLDQLAVYIDRDLTARRQVKSALTYPTVVLVVTMVAMGVMSVFVLPKFAGMYSSLGAELPLPTRLLLGWTDFFTGNLPFIALGVLLVLAAAFAAIGGTHGKQRRDRMLMKLPVVGHLFHIISLERFCRVLAALAKAGVPLPDAIEMSAASTNNTVFVARMVDVRETLVRGGGLSTPIAETELFPTAARQMIRVGEKTGSLSAQLSKAANYYEREVGYGLQQATELFQPAVIMFVGGLVGFVAVAQVSAMYSIFSQVQTP
jgi:type IV pilus assembly protein PilC